MSNEIGYYQQTAMEMQMRQAQIKHAVEWEKQRAMALQNAYAQQQSDLARLQQMQNALSGLAPQYLGSFGGSLLGSMTGASVSTTGSMYADSTTASYSSPHTCDSASGRSEHARKVVQKTWTEPAEKRREEKPVKLTLKTSPLFAPPKFMGLYWTTRSPFEWMEKALIRLALRLRRNSQIRSHA